MGKESLKHSAKTIYEVLKNRILSWESLPGQRITEQALCEEFKVSRVPVREALRMLIDTGLVDKVPNVGCRVRKLSVEDINQLYELRTALELYAVEVLAGMPDAMARIADLKAEWTAHSTRTEAGKPDPAFWRNADERFHETLVDSLANPVLSKALRDVNERIRFLRAKDITTLERLKNTCSAHMDILAAIEQGSPRKARKLLHQNILMGRSNVQESFKEALMKAYTAS